LSFQSPEFLREALVRSARFQDEHCLPTANKQYRDLIILIALIDHKTMVTISRTFDVHCKLFFNLSLKLLEFSVNWSG